jgi:hypothetical protein
LDTLYDVIKSKKRNHNYSEKLIEEIMYKYLELCVDLKKSHVAKEGLFQYRNMCQSVNVASLASVVQVSLSGLCWDTSSQCWGWSRSGSGSAPLTTGFESNSGSDSFLQ